MSETLIIIIAFALIMFFMHRGHGGMGGCGGHSHNAHGDKKTTPSDEKNAQVASAHEHHH